MAFELLSQKKTVATNLGEYISSQLTLLAQNRLRKNLEDEQNFNKAVMEDNLSLDQQLTYREDQLKKVESSDRDEKLRIRKEISALKDRVEQQKFTDNYLSQLTDLNAGTQSIETTINWLNSTLSRTTDPTIQNNIKDNISQLQGKLYEQRRNALTSATTYATGSQDSAIINKQITSINDARVEALQAGNKDYVALLDLQMQTLNKAKAETEISKTLMNFSVATMTGNSATALLNEFNKQLESVDTTIPVTIGGVRYDSAKSFWELKRSEYLNDRSENGFFTRYQSELNEKINYKGTKNILNNDTFKDVNNWYDTLKDRPEMATYMERIDQDKQKGLSTTAEIRSAGILNDFAIKLDAKKALNELAYIQDTYGVDQSLNYQKIVTSAAKEKQEQVSQILSTMSSIMAANPGATSQQAMEQAIKSGAGASLSPEELATQNASSIISNLSTSAEKQQFGENQPLTVDGSMAGKFSAPNLKEGEYYKAANDSTVYKYESGALRPLSGSWDENSFKQYAGKGFDSINAINSVASLSKGTPITKADVTATTPTEAVGERISSPELLKYYQPDQIITKGTDKFLKSGVKSVLGDKLNGESWTKLQSQYKDPKQVEDKVIRLGSDIYLKAY